MKRVIFTLFAVLLSSGVTRTGISQSQGIPKTGQTDVYHGPGDNDPGDDGTVQAGYPLTGSRGLAFQDNGNGTVTDLASGLMWQKGDSGSAMTWAAAFSYVASLNTQNYGGKSDWRVPNIKELASIINDGTWLPSVYYIFESMSGDYWSSTSLLIQSQQQVYYIAFNEGYVQFCLPSASRYVKAVRSYLPGSGSQGFPRTGQGWLSAQVFHPGNGSTDLGDDGVTRSGYPLPTSQPSYIDNGNGTVTQVATGLVWQQEDSGAQTFGGYSGDVTWEEGFSYIADMNARHYAGYSDWRMPNYFELISLLDFGYFWPIIDTNFFQVSKLPSGQYPYFWSSTNRFGITPPDNAWSVSWSSGWGVTRVKTETAHIRAVRGGPVVMPTPVPAKPTPTPYPIYGVTKTGQTLIVYPGSDYNRGDDGSTRVGYPATGSRFQDNLNGTITDNGAGLMWQKADSGTPRSWAGAFAYVASLNSSHFKGYSDWRVPNIKELNSLVNIGLQYPAIDPIFSETKTAGYWGSTTYADLVNGQRCYQVDFNEGNMLWINMEDPGQDSGYVRAVRSLVPQAGNWGFPKSGQTNIIHYPSGYDMGDDGVTQAGYPANRGARFVDNGDGTVTDRATRLIWQKTDSNYLPVGSYSGYLTWEQAFEYVREMNKRKVSGYTQWRLPNYHELSSLFDFSQFNPTLAPVFQYTVQSAYHWSSSSRASNPYNDHWVINFTNGSGLWQDGSTGTAYVMAVLGGPGQYINPQETTPTPGYGPTPVWGPTPPPGPPPPPYTHLYYGLPRTGQTSQYHYAGSYDEGDDGVTRIGYPASGNRWEDTGNGTVIDWATGLMWQKSCSHVESFGGLNGTMTWEEAFQYVARMNHDSYGGYSDWRLPNALELASTRNLENGSSEPSAFVDTAYDPFWSSTCSAGPGTSAVFRLSYSYGQILQGGITDNVRSLVRACRSFYDGTSSIGFPKTGQTKSLHQSGWYDLGDDGANRAGFPVSGERFSDNGNGTVTDNATGLIWQKGHSTGQMNWASAFDYVEDELNRKNHGGFSDWRVPNQMELYSIVDYGSYYPTIAPVFSGTEPGFFWSSNTLGDKSQTTNAWAINFANGVGDIYPKTDNKYVRGVRGDPVMAGIRPTPTPDAGSLIIGSGDYNGDGASDLAVFRPSAGLWAVRGVTRAYFGSSSDLPVSGDYNGDGTAEIGLYRPASGLWAVKGVTRAYFGSSSDTPVPGDYNGDGSCDLAIWRRASGLWAVRGISRVYFGSSGDQPVPGRYGTVPGKNMAVFRPTAGLWAIRGVTRVYFGNGYDMIVPGDYNGDGIWETGIFRPASGLWAIRGVTRSYFGNAADHPMPGNYNGYSGDELGIYRESAGLWAIKGTTRVYFGSSGDIPVTR